MRGSQEWLRAIAEALGSQLLGIERRDYSGLDINPKYQIRFVIPQYPDKAPQELLDVEQFDPSFRVVNTWESRGKQRVAVLQFTFSHLESLPNREILASVAQDFGCQVFFSRPNEENWYKP